MLLYCYLGQEHGGYYNAISVAWVDTKTHPFAFGFGLQKSSNNWICTAQLIQDATQHASSAWQKHIKCLTFHSMVCLVVDFRINETSWLYMINHIQSTVIQTTVSHQEDDLGWHLWPRTWLKQLGAHTSMLQTWVQFWSEVISQSLHISSPLIFCLTVLS